MAKQAQTTTRDALNSGVAGSNTTFDEGFIGSIANKAFENEALGNKAKGAAEQQMIFSCMAHHANVVRNKVGMVLPANQPIPSLALYANMQEDKLRKALLAEMVQRFLGSADLSGKAEDPARAERIRTRNTNIALIRRAMETASMFTNDGVSLTQFDVDKALWSLEQTRMCHANQRPAGKGGDVLLTNSQYVVQVLNDKGEVTGFDNFQASVARYKAVYRNKRQPRDRNNSADMMTATVIARYDETIKWLDVYLTPPDDNKSWVANMSDLVPGEYAKLLLLQQKINDLFTKPGFKTPRK